MIFRGKASMIMLDEHGDAVVTTGEFYGPPGVDIFRPGALDEPEPTFVEIGPEVDPDTGVVRHALIRSDALPYPPEETL